MDNPANKAYTVEQLGMPFFKRYICYQLEQCQRLIESQLTWAVCVCPWFAVAYVCMRWMDRDDNLLPLRKFKSPSGFCNWSVISWNTMQYYFMVQVYNQQYKSDELAVHNQVNQLCQVYLINSTGVCQTAQLSFLPFSFMIYRFHRSTAQLMADKTLLYSRIWDAWTRMLPGKQGLNYGVHGKEVNRLIGSKASINPAQSDEWQLTMHCWVWYFLKYLC